MYYQCTKLVFSHCFQNIKSYLNQSSISRRLWVEISSNFDAYRLKVGTNYKCAIRVAIYMEVTGLPEPPNTSGCETIKVKPI